MIHSFQFIEFVSPLLYHLQSPPWFFFFFFWFCEHAVFVLTSRALDILILLLRIILYSYFHLLTARILLMLGLLKIFSPVSPLWFSNSRFSDPSTNIYSYSTLFLSPQSLFDTVGIASLLVFLTPQHHKLLECRDCLFTILWFSI